MRILGGSWPSTSPESWSETANALSKKSADLSMSAAAIRRAADDLGGSNSGQMIEAMCERAYRTAQTVINHSDLYGDMAKAVKETAELIWHVRGRLEEIDRRAHEEIERLKQQLQAAASSPLGAGAAMAAIAAAIEAVIDAAAAEARAADADTAAAIAQQAANIGGNSSSQMPGSGQITPADHTTHATGNGDNVQALDTFGPRSGEPPTPHQTRPENSGGTGLGGDSAGEDSAPSPSDQRPEGSGDQGAGTETPSGKPEAAPATPAPEKLSDSPKPFEMRPEGSGSQLMPPVSAAPTTGSGGGGSSPLGSIGSGFKPPSSAGLSSAGTGGLSPSSLSSNAGLSSSLPSSVSPAAGGLPSAAAGGGGAATSSDFSRGFNAGLGTGSVLPPPVAPPPAQPLSSTTGASSAPVSAGPAPVSAAGGPAHVASPTSAAGVPAGHMGSMGAPMMPPAAAPAGPLPPFNSDLQPRQVAPAAAGAPPPAAPPSPPASAGQATPLPPGVVASGVGATAAGAAAGAWSVAPDPLLDQAVKMLHELMHASRVYGCIDWCIGMFKTPSGPKACVVSNEGSGFIPPGVFLPKSAEFVFADGHLDRDFHARWFGWVNPAQTMLAYAQQCMQINPNVELWALAVSTNHGGNAAPARDAGLLYVQNCRLEELEKLGITADVPPPGLDETRIHRLQTMDPAEYGLLTAGGTVDRSRLWALTVAAVRTALSRASELLGFQVPPAIRQVATAIENGEPVSEQLWTELDLAMRAAILDSSGQRPGRVAGDVGPSAYARCFHNVARAAELLLWWRGTTPDYVEIAYTARHIAKEAELWPTMAA